MSAFKCYQNMVVDSGEQTKRARHKNSQKAATDWSQARREAKGIVYGENGEVLDVLGNFYKEEYSRWNGITMRKRRNHTITGLFAKGE